MMRTLEDPSVVACQTMVADPVHSSDEVVIDPHDPATGIRARVAAVVKLIQNVRLHVLLLAGSAFVTGLIEAAFLVAIARIGLAVADGQSSVGLTRGVDISVNQALGVAGVLIFIRLLMALAAVRVQMGLTYRVTTRLRRDLAQAFLRSSWATQQSQPAGTLQQLVVTFPNHGANLLNALSGATGAGLSLLAMLLVAVVVSPSATLLVVGALVILSAVLRPLRKRISGRSEASIPHQMAFSNGVAQVSALGLEIQAFGVRPQAEDRLDDLITNEAAAARRVGLIANIVSPIYVTLGYAAVLGALVVVASIGTNQLQSSGAVMLVMLRALGYGQLLQGGSVALAQILPFLHNLNKSVKEFRGNAATNGDIQIQAIGEIRFHNVSFEYEPGRSVLSDISFDIQPGEVIGIIGPSGGGKSTLVQLLLGLREPTKGSVTINGANLAKVDRDSWSHRVAFVPQDANLITGSVADNIAFFRPKISVSTMTEAAHQAHVLDEINSLPEGFATSIGERGVQLSGGQRQRIAIARALAGQPELLILDEPTSALDLKAESVIRDTISVLKGKVTVVIIAHRISTLEACDRLMVIQKGQMTAYAPARQLATDDRFYQKALQLAGIALPS
jgi:ATP-binding cassette, subfamily B, bacterial